MPYINGVRVSAQEWADKYGSLIKLHTGPNGDNPADPPVIDEETGGPVDERKAGSRRSSKSRAKVASAIAVATGTELDA